MKLRIDKMRLAELEKSPIRGSQAIWEAVKAGHDLTVESLLPVVIQAYYISAQNGNGKPRTAAYCKKQIEKTIKWLTY